MLSVGKIRNICLSNYEFRWPNSSKEQWKYIGWLIRSIHSIPASKTTIYVYSREKLMPANSKVIKARSETLRKSVLINEDKILMDSREGYKNLTIGAWRQYQLSTGWSQWIHSNSRYKWTTIGYRFRWPETTGRLERYDKNWRSSDFSRCIWEASKSNRKSIFDKWI